MIHMYIDSVHILGVAVAVHQLYELAAVIHTAVEAVYGSTVVH